MNMEKVKSINMWNNTFGVIKENLKKFLLSSLVLLVIYTFLYGFWHIPFIDFGINRMSPIVFLDWVFVILVSLLTSIFLTLFRYEKANNFSSNSSAGAVGVGFGGFSAICPVCQSVGLVAFGTTFLNIPTGFLIPYLGPLKIISLGILGLAVFMKADSIHTKKCESCEIIPKSVKTKKTKKHPLLSNKYVLWSLTALIVLIFINQLLIPKAFALAPGGSFGSVSIGMFEYGSKITLKPMPLASGEQPKISGYRSIVKPLPTISELVIKPLTGDQVQDLLNNIVPSGIPWYGEQAGGVSFDDPIKSQKLWGKGEAIQLTKEEESRWGRIVNSFTCDYCCGSPKNPTIITRCGCAHASAAKGMAKWFIKYYGDKYSDEEIYGEMARWYALWYPKGTIERILQESK